MELKYSAVPFAQYPDIELIKKVSVLLLKIHVIAGWVIPQKELQDILVDQLFKKIRESYGTVNEQEFEAAFRNNLSVKDWGKNINLVLIDTVLSEYLDRRADVSRMEEHYRLAAKELPPPPEDELTDEDFIEANRAVYQLTKSYGLIAVKCYDILVSQGKINLSIEEKQEIRQTVTSSLFAADNPDNVKGMRHEKQERIIRQDSKKWATALYFNSLVK